MQNHELKHAHRSGTTRREICERQGASRRFIALRIQAASALPFTGLSSIELKPILSTSVLKWTPFLLLACFSVIQTAFGNDTTSPITKPDLVFLESNGIVAVEAEHFVLQEKTDIRAWHRIRKNEIPKLGPDPDKPHLDGVSNNCYLEALPDTRTTHDDELFRGENFFAKPALAGILTYNIEFTTPGRYYVWVRHYSTGSEDNGIHVGLDGTWPESGRRWQTTKRNKWAWESRQRTKEVHAGIKFKLYLDVEKAGLHQIHFSMREDGFEFDKFVLASDIAFAPKGIGPNPVVSQRTLPAKPSAKAAKVQIRPPRGRLAIVADGNSPDPDDIGATAVMFGLLKAAGLQNRLVHLSHSCDLRPTKRISVKDELRRQKVLDQVCRKGVDSFGPFNNLTDFFNCRTQQQQAIDDLRKGINDSSQQDPLWIIEAGEPDIIGYALKAADSTKTKYVHIVSHHPANDNAGDFFAWKQILAFGVVEHQIGDQNVGLKTKPDIWDWAKDHANPNMNWIWKQLAYAEQDGVVKFQTNKFDCSDAGMLHWWITGADQGGNADATPAPIAALLTGRISTQRLPDIVVYLADDLSARDLSLYGGTNIQTPAIDQLAADGMTFNRAFVASPSCASSRAAFLTGLMPAKNGAEENHSYPRPDVLKLPKVLGELGYQTAAFGKVAHLRSAPDYHFEVHDGKKDIPQLRETVKEFLENRTDQRPLALFVGTSDPHVPWPSESTVDAEYMTLPPKLLDTPRTRVQRSRYLQEVKNLDAYLGELRELTAKHLSKDQLFLFSSDHGAQFPFGKWTLYDEGIHVPLIVAKSGMIKPNSRTDAMVSWVDILPTLIEYGGGEVPKNLDGRSFLNVLTGESNSHRLRIFTTHSGDRKMNVYLSRSVRTEGFKLIWNPHPEFAFTTHIDLLLRETSGDYFKEWKELAKSNKSAAAAIARHHGRSEFELYHLKSDPFEQVNLAGKSELKEKQAKMLAALNKWIKEQGDELSVFHEPLMLDAPGTWMPRKIKQSKNK